MKALGFEEYQRRQGAAFREAAVKAMEHMKAGAMLEALRVAGGL